MAVKTEDKLRDFYERRHPAYDELVGHWRFLEETYRGGRRWFEQNIHRYHKEGDREYAARLKRAYRFNHTKEVVELLQKYLFKGDVQRNIEEAPDVVKEFWKRATLTGLDIHQFMRQVSAGTSITGRVAIVVDNNFRAPVNEDGKVRPVSVAEASKQSYRIYAYMVSAKDILDYAWDDDGDGELLWIKLREVVRDDKDPHNSSGELSERVRLWTRDGWELYEEVEAEGYHYRGGRRYRNRRVELVESGKHNLGFVPVRLVDHTISEDPYRVPGLIDDVAYLDCAVANYLSNLDAIIQDQTFSQLAIPAQAIQSGDDMFQKVLEMGTKRVFVYDGGAGSTAKPEYLSPDPKQAGVIIDVINKIINEIYHTIGLAGERTKQDNAVGIDNSSGVAKAYDFERVNSLLLSKAQICQAAENWIVRAVLAWAKEEAPEYDLVTYPSTFDIASLNDELITAEALAKIDAPAEVRREQMRTIVDKIFPQLKEELRAKLLDDIDDWLEGSDMPVAPTSVGSSDDKPVAAPNRQGEVTRTTNINNAAKTTRAAISRATRRT